MDSPKELIAHELDALRQTRDELRVKLHLGSQDAKDAWDKLERKLLELEDNAKQLAHNSEPVHHVSDAARLLVAEIKEGYQRFVENSG
jgi:hypothetical protein